MFQKSSNETCAKANNKNVFKTNMITIPLDSSEYHFASKKLMDLVGTEMLEFIRGSVNKVREGWGVIY